MNVFGLKSLVVCCIYLTVLVVLLFCVASADRDAVKFHVRKLTLLKKGPFLAPRTAIDVFRSSTLQWLMLGRPTFQQWGDRLEEEQQTLVRLGYYNRKWFPWKESDVEWQSAFTNTAVWRGRYYVHGDYRRPTEIRITARPCDIAEFDAIVRTQLDKRGVMPQPDAAANQSQAVLSDTNLMSEAAGSGR